MLSILIDTPSSMLSELKERFRAMRKDMKFTQEELAKRSGVSLGSLKRFESTGQISLESLLCLAHALGCLKDFSDIAALRKASHPSSMSELLSAKSSNKNAKTQ